MTNNGNKNKTITSLLTPRWMIKMGKLLNAVSPALACKYAFWLFLKPFKYPLPEREKEMYQKSKKETLPLEGYPEKITIYHYGEGSKKILLAHGWSGTGTQLSKIANQLLAHGYSTISFDAPGHGKAPGKSSMMPHFIASIHQLHRNYGPFNAAIGHSIGGMALMRAIKEGLPLHKLIIIGTANSMTTTLNEFVKNIQLTPNIAIRMKQHFDKVFGQDVNNYSGAISAKSVTIPTLVIHDENDLDVPISNSQEIYQNLVHGEFYKTQKLGHRKILGNRKVIEKITTYILKKH